MMTQHQREEMYRSTMIDQMHMITLMVAEHKNEIATMLLEALIEYDKSCEGNLLEDILIDADEEQGEFGLEENRIRNIDDYRKWVAEHQY